RPRAGPILFRRAVLEDVTDEVLVLRHHPTIAARPADYVVRSGVSDPSSTTTQPSYSVKSNGAFMGTLAVPLSSVRKLPQSAPSWPSCVSQSWNGRPLAAGARSSTENVIGQLPAASRSSTSSEADADWAAAVPSIAMVPGNGAAERVESLLSAAPKAN